MAHVVVPGPKRTTLGPKTQESVFIGYSQHSKAYRFRVVSGQDKDSIIESRDTVFFENHFPFKQVLSGSCSRPPHDVESGSEDSAEPNPVGVRDLKRNLPSDLIL